jgi:hypothetical protein
MAGISGENRTIGVFARRAAFAPGAPAGVARSADRRKGRLLPTDVGLRHAIDATVESAPTPLARRLIAGWSGSAESPINPGS